MSERKLVSVITGSNRPHLLAKLITNIREQTYPNIEHCIGSECVGQDKELVEAWHSNNWTQIDGDFTAVPIKFVQAGRHWSKFLANSISAVPYRMAQDLSSGDYLMWAADDELFDSDHIELLVDLLEKEDVDFVYSKTEIWFNPQMGMSIMPNVIGEEVPKCGNITQALYRAELLDYAGFETHVGSGTDWHQIKTWMDAGASWAFLDKVSHSHRVDKLGDAHLNKEKQPLRGVLNGRSSRIPSSA